MKSLIEMPPNPKLSKPLHIFFLNHNKNTLDTSFAEYQLYHKFAFIWVSIKITIEINTYHTAFLLLLNFYCLLIDKYLL